jgi:hypothetical protein
MKQLRTLGILFKLTLQILRALTVAMAMAMTNLESS